MRYIGTTPNQYGDTLLTSDADDQINVKVGGAEDFRISANTLSVLSGTTLNIDSGATIANSGTATGFGSGLASGDVIPADDGSVGAPGLSFADDTDNGLYRIGADNFGVAVAGALAMEFDPIGAVQLPLQPSFNAYSGTNQASATGDGTVVTVGFDVERHDINADYNTSTFTFTAPVDGTYLLTFSVRFDDATTANDEATFNINTSNYLYNHIIHPGYLVEQDSGAERVYWRMQALVYMDAADTSTCSMAVKGATKIVDVRNDQATTFSGVLIA